ncbi:polysaccharide deacetylase family protein [Catellatospora tritici]|uniref:polysaccharide deacetylase family protein n=1 Tax=Catellatospora tritici TaxID=2851566 RepID=UPI001C2D5EA5|nr:polysaccharide deacetylase family protein [Catellatospora tritici]MBV1853462.1 polysaccharide deacetylase family protein [Catellatospora tritici]
MASTPARRVLAVLPLLAVLTLNACDKADPPTFAGPATPSASPSDMASPTPSVTPSPTPSPKPVVSPKGPKTLDWYMSQVPHFPDAPEPKRVHVTESSSSVFWFRVPTEQKVAFITIDDGALSRPSMVPEFIRQAGIPVTMFLNSPAATRYTDYFKAIEDAGGVVENHTITHTSLKGKSYDFQKHEICGSADKLEQLFGKRPTLFRPPFGERDKTTLRAAQDCGMHASFYWTQTVDKGIVRYQTAQKVVKPGDVLLMHFRPALMDDLLAALKAIYRSGLTPALLEDYVDFDAR